VPETLRILDSLEDVDPADWDALAGGNPTVAYAFLDSLHRTGCASTRTGWSPQYASAWEGERLVGAAPLYVKTHSYGEYVFDHGWANAYEQAGGRYYPKLLVGVPFTPVPGPRLLARPGADEEANRQLLAEGLVAATRQLGVSSLHVNFADDNDCRSLSEAGLMRRVATQYHWQNDGYKTFADFLTSLSSRKRKMIRKEREAALRLWDPGLRELKTDPLMDPLRKEPRFEAIQRELGV